MTTRTAAEKVAVFYFDYFLSEKSGGPGGGRTRVQTGND
jgi:hypothetical protein